MWLVLQMNFHSDGSDSEIQVLCSPIAPSVYTSSDDELGACRHRTSNNLTNQFTEETDLGNSSTLVTDSRFLVHSTTASSGTNSGSPERPRNSRYYDRYERVVPKHTETKYNTASTKSSSSVDRLLDRRQFHRSSGSVRARYIYPNATTKKSTKTLATSFCPQSRYTQQPRSTKSRSAARNDIKWPEPPRYPPKAKHAEVECHILKLVEQLDIGTQCSAEMVQASAQCTVRTADISSQYPRVRRKEAASQTVETELKDQAIQNTPDMRSRMVETSIRVLYVP